MISADNIEIFNGRGEMLPLEEISAQLESLGDEATKRRFVAVREAYEADAAARDATKAAKEHVIECADAVRSIQDRIRERFPPMDGTTAAKQWIQSQRLTQFGHV